jgi:bile acid-coenzyme A ligase
MTHISMSRIVGLWADRKPGAIAVSHETDTVTWAELEARTNQLARAYQALGVVNDDFVTIALPNSIEFIEASIAIWKLGATPQPVSAKLPKIERDAIVEVGQPTLVVGVPDGEHGDVTTLPVGFTADSALSTQPLPECNATSWKAMTSGGSTGRPKLIVSKQESTWDPDAPFMQFQNEGSVLIPGPLYHNGPFIWAIGGLFKGNHVTITTRFDAEDTLRLIEAQAVDTVYMVPTMMQRIWNLEEQVRLKYDLSSLKVLWHLAAPCPIWLKEAFIEWLGPERIWELYGGTEGTGGTVITGAEWLAHKGSVGIPNDTCEMKVVDEDGNTLPAGETGEIFIRPKSGPGSTYRYVGAEAKSMDGGWESLGDIGHLDADGYLYLSDRLTDMIISGGANIFPAEVEAAIDAYPGVRSSCVIGLPSDDLGNIVHAIVDVPEQNLAEDTLLAHLAEHLVRYKIPRTLEFVSEPLRDDAGKVRRKSLRAERLDS